MSGKVDLGDLFVNGTNAQVVMSTDGSEIESTKTIARPAQQSSL